MKTIEESMNEIYDYIKTGKVVEEKDKPLLEDIYNTDFFTTDNEVVLEFVDRIFDHIGKYFIDRMDDEDSKALLTERFKDMIHSIIFYFNAEYNYYNNDIKYTDEEIKLNNIAIFLILNSKFGDNIKKFNLINFPGPRVTKYILQTPIDKIPLETFRELKTTLTGINDGSEIEGMIVTANMFINTKPENIYKVKIHEHVDEKSNIAHIHRFTFDKPHNTLK